MKAVFRRTARVAATGLFLLFALAPAVLAGDGDGEDEDAKLFEDDGADDKPSDTAAAKPGSNANDDDEESVFRRDPADIGISPNVFEDQLTLGGQLYLRLNGNVVDSGSFGEQRIAMPNLLDLYLDARPVERVRAYVRGRLSYDPTVGSESTDLFGIPAEPLSVVLDQLWLKTDIARTLYITLGKQRVKWGESRLWNPTDFLNNTRRDPLAFFDERTGVNLLKLHFPIESLDWNIYLVGILDGVNQWDRAGGAARMEMALGPTEWSVSFAAGKNMKTAVGVGVSAPIWDFDFSAELSLTDESGVTKYTGPFAPTSEDFANCLPAVDDPTLIPGCLNPPSRQLSGWYPRVSGGLTYAFRYNDGQDLMLLGIEYFYNSTGYSNIDPYAWLLLDGGFQPFYLGKHYAGFVWSVPSPGDWDDVTFTTSTLANLSDLSVVTRLDVSMTFFTRLRVEAYVMGHYGTPGGELRFELDVPESLEGLDLGIPLSRIPKPVIDWGINLRLAI